MPQKDVSKGSGMFETFLAKRCWGAFLTSELICAVLFFVYLLPSAQEVLVMVDYFKTD